MTKEEKVNYWIEVAEKDWRVMEHLFEKGDYPYALFFGHLTIEKLLKKIKEIKGWLLKQLQL
jgi:HEPN domain-containing protein